MGSYSFDEATLASAAGVNPWEMQRQLATGDPAAIESLAAAFFSHSSHSAAAAAATKASQRYVRQGYTVQGSSPLDVNAEAKRLVDDPQIGSDHTYQIGKVLRGIGTDLDTAATKASTEVNTLNARIGTLLQQFEQTVALYHHTGQDREQDSGEDAVLHGIFSDAVSATKTHGATVGQLLSGYETNLHTALKSMADLGYVPPDGHDEGPGGIDLTAGTKDGATTVAAARDGNSARLAQSTYALSIINDAIAHDGGRVGDGEYGYLYQYYQQTAAHSDVILKAVRDGHAQSTVGTTYADGLLNLTRGAEQTTDDGTPTNACSPTGGTVGRGGVDGLPPAVQNVLHSDLGTVADGGDGTNMRRAEYVDGHWVIKNLSNDSGFSELLTYASKNSQGGTGFSQALGEAGLRWKQELNAVDHNTAAWVDADRRSPRDLGAPDIDPKKLHLPDGFTGKTGPGGQPVNDDQFASDALATASRNATASTNLLLDTGDRRTLLGLNWNHGDGASDVITAGTAPDPTGHSQRNEATLAVMQDVGHDYKNFDAMANGQVKSALTLMGTRHMDTFAQDELGQGGSHVGTIVGPDGKTYRGVILNGQDQSNFLKMVAESGPSNYGLFHAAALEEGSRYIAGAHGTHYPAEAIRQASLLNGRVTNAGTAAVVDSTQTSNTNDKALYAAQLIQEQKQATQDWGQKLVGDGIDVVLGGAAIVQPELAPAIGVVAYLKGTMDTVTTDVGGPGDPHNPDTQAIQALQNNLATVADDPHMLAKAALDTTSGQEWMAARAQALEHPVDNGAVGPDDRRPVTALTDNNGQPLPDFGQSTDPNAPGKLENLMLATYGADKGNGDATTGANQVLATDNGQGESWDGGKPDADDRSLDGNGSWGNGKTAYTINYGNSSTYDWDQYTPVLRGRGVPPAFYYRFEPAENSPK